MDYWLVLRIEDYFLIFASQDRSGAMARVVLYDKSTDQWFNFLRPFKIISTHHNLEVAKCLQEIELIVNTKDLYAVGFISYEAASAFDKVLVTHPKGKLPLLWFCIFDSYDNHEPRSNIDDSQYELNWQPEITESQYGDRLATIKSLIQRGDTYQVNYTYRQACVINESPWSFFQKMRLAQESNYAAYIEDDEFVICSASPELFFALNGDKILTKPMKGTEKRGLTYHEDLFRVDQLQSSEKIKSENIMITDMMRNDLSKIAKRGSVVTRSLCDIEKYPTVWQMTSTVEAHTDGSITDIFKALFPCSSITGAPKRRSMEIIKSLEKSPREIYTGAIGYIFPKRKSQFSVAIRTAVIDKRNQVARYGTGGGIVFDSVIEEEYKETIVKAKVLSTTRPDFELLETMLWTQKKGFFLLENHLQRIYESSIYFNYNFNRLKLTQHLDKEAVSFRSDSHYKVRILLSLDGTLRIESSKIESSYESGKVKLTLAHLPISSQNILLYHKTTHRQVYNDFLKSHPSFDDVILFNERDEITECCNYNIIIQKGDRMTTPPISSGLLGGTYRSFLIDQHKIKEEVTTIEELRRAKKVYVINSVRLMKEAIIQI